MKKLTSAAMIFFMGLVCFSYGFFPYCPAVLADIGPETVSNGSPPTVPENLRGEISMFFRFIFALAIVLILLILTLWVLRQALKVRFFGAAGGAIDLLAIRHIDQRKAIALVRVGNRVLIVGLAENSLSSLGELTSEEIGALTLDKNDESGIRNLPVFKRFFGRKAAGDGR